MAAQPPKPVAALARATWRSATYRGSLLARLSVPVALVLATLLVADVLRLVFPGSGVFLLLLLPVLIASTTLGAVSGVVALALGVVGAVLLVVMHSHPWLLEPIDALRLVPYLFIGGFIVLVASLLRRAAARRPPEPRPPSRCLLIERLTDREAEVLSLAASGLSTSQIGERLYLSRNTVKSHLQHGYAKLGAHNRAEAVAAGLHSGMLNRRAITSRAAQITAGLTRTAPSPKASGRRLATR